MRLSLCLVLITALGAAGCPPPLTGADAGSLGDGFESLEVTGPSSLVLEVSRDVDPTSVTPSAFVLVDYTTIPAEEAAVLTVELDGKSITLNTSMLLAGRTYTLVVDGLQDAAGQPITGTLNFVAVGELLAVDVSFVVLDVEAAREWQDLALLITACETGAFCEQVREVPMIDEGDRFAAASKIQIDPLRTLTPFDDDDPSADRRAYAVRLIDGQGTMAGPLVPFVIASFDDSRTIELNVVRPPDVVEPPDPLPPPPEDPNPADGLKRVRIVVDDRAARELSSPELKLSFGADGAFDATFPQAATLTTMAAPYEGWWEATVSIAVDPARVADGQTPDTFPYFAFLIESGTEYEALSVALTAPDETPETKRLGLGNPEWTPVTFRVDVSGAFVTADGSVKGVHPGEAVFLTGEWQVAVDALGNNCGDAFSGGEQLNLQMRELDGHPGVWTRTLWLPPGRPYGWKVARCAAGVGCGPLNQLVASSGRAFATVMKNLVTDNVDAFADPEVGLVDPLALADVEAAGTTWDYSGASVHVGSQMGSEPDPDGTPDGVRLFKQEVPDLVVVVGDEAVVTNIFHVGTWRDINLGQTPQQIIDSAAVIELGPYDYDDGFIGRFPPSREAP